MAIYPCYGAEKPNVVLLLTDDQRADTIAALGNPIIRTPNLDTLAAEGFVFRNAYCMGSTVPAVCNPSRHMLLSGMSLYRYGAKRESGTFADVMNRAGYVTWHVGKRGNTAQQYHKAFQHSTYLDEQKERMSGQPGQAAADLAIAFLQTGWDRKQPLFMYIAFEGPHDPRVADNQWMRLYHRNQIPVPPNFKPFHPFNNGELLIRDEQLAPWPRTSSVVRKHLHDYYACISSIDYHVGRILAALQEQGQFDNTIFVFTSDHGLAIGSHGLFGKQNLYEHSMKSPLLIAGPGIPKGRSDSFIYLFDIFPTVADLVGAGAPSDLDGQSLVPVMRGRSEGVRDTVFLAYRQVQRAVRQDDWKLIRYPQVDVTQLFNVHDDPHELDNLAEDPGRAEKVREMLLLLAKEQKCFGDTASLRVKQPQPADVDVKFFTQQANTGRNRPN
ncbi:MAG: sulfatase-like hydrolase/transferase [Pirellulales bacterium]